MWSLMAFCLAYSMLTTNGRNPQEDSWLWWLPQDTDSSNTIYKRTGPSLSIVNPLDVLRQRLQLDNARRRQYENEQRIRENELLLRNLGKRRT